MKNENKLKKVSGKSTTSIMTLKKKEFSEKEHEIKLLFYSKSKRLFVAFMYPVPGGARARMTEIPAGKSSTGYLPSGQKMRINFMIRKSHIKDLSVGLEISSSGGD